MLQKLKAVIYTCTLYARLCVSASIAATLKKYGLHFHSALGLSQLCFKICPLCFYGIAAKLCLLCSKVFLVCLKFLHEHLPCDKSDGFVAFFMSTTSKRDAGTLAMDVWPDCRASSMSESTLQSLLRSRLHSQCPRLNRSRIGHRAHRGCH